MLDDFATGSHTVTYWTIDDFDNNSGILEMAFDMIGSPPVFTGDITATNEYIVAGDLNYYDFNNVWVSGVISDPDDDLDTDSCEYSIDDGLTWASTTPDINFNTDTNRCDVNLDFEWGNTGWVQIKFRITDDEDNTTESDDMNWYLDNTAPTTVGTFNGLTTLTLTATDIGTPAESGSGTANIYYSIDGDAWVTVAAVAVNITVATPGDHHIYFYSQDNLDNNEMRDNLSGDFWDKPFTVPGISPTGSMCNLTNLMILVLVAVVLISLIYAGFGVVSNGLNIQSLIAIAISAISILIIIFIAATVNGTICTV